MVLLITSHFNKAFELKAKVALGGARETIGGGESELFSTNEKIELKIQQ